MAQDTIEKNRRRTRTLFATSPEREMTLRNELSHPSGDAA